MKHPLLAVIAAFFVVFSTDAPGQENGEVSFQLFYDSLAPYGDWVDVDGYGYCWQPRVKSGWRPYSDGRWAYTEAGWTWVSNEDFGWATYHYGRWTKLRNRGWLWVPGYEWAPAWVSWRTNDEYVGWAPLPPEAVWNASQGFNVTVDANYDIGPDYYNFCPIGSFGSTGLAPIIVNPVNNVTIVYNTINITYINIYQRGIYCGGPNWNYINQRCRQPIPQYRLDRRRNYDWASLRERGGRAVVQNGALSIPAPRFGRDVPQGRPRNVAYQASRNDVNRGWDDVRDSRARDQVRERNQQQARALQNQPRPAIAALPTDIGQPIGQQGNTNPSRSRGNGGYQGDNGSNRNDWSDRGDRNNRGNRGDQQANNQPQNQTPPTSSGAIATNPSNNPSAGTNPSTRPALGSGSANNRPNDRRRDRGDDRAELGRQRQEEAMQQQTEEQRQRRQALQQQYQSQQQTQQRQQSLQQQQAQQRLDQQRQEMRNRVAEQQRQQQSQQQQQQNFQRQQQQMDQQRQQNQQRRQQQQFPQSQQPRQSQQVQQSQQPRQSQQVQQSQQPRQSQQMPQNRQFQQQQQQSGGMGQGRRQQGQ